MTESVSLITGESELIEMLRFPRGVRPASPFVRRPGWISGVWLLLRTDDREIEDAVGLCCWKEALGEVTVGDDVTAGTVSTVRGGRTAGGSVGFGAGVV
jgi:acetyltransferase-like isoleucine patch superfamily enzyme